MSLLATRADFEPTDEDEAARALYFDPSTGSGYDPRAPFFADRLASLAHMVRPPATVAIWGAGWASLVNLARAAGYIAHGYDASGYAISRGRETHPFVAAFLHQRDATSATDVRASLTDAHVECFDLTITEDMLPCLSDAEIAACLPLLRTVCHQRPVHMVTPGQGQLSPDSRLNWKSLEEWGRLVEPDVVYDATENRVIKSWPLSQ